MSQYGVSGCGSVLIWIEKFLINRCQCVRVGNGLSEYADVVSVKLIFEGSWALLLNNNSR